MQGPSPGKMKPKIIKRLAQNHEIQALRDKGGNEAKAKRVCMQKVKEQMATLTLDNYVKQTSTPRATSGSDSRGSWGVGF